MRVALLTNLIAPYRLPVYRDLAATPGWTLRVLVDARSDPTWETAFAGAHEAGCADLDVEVVSGASLRRRVKTVRGVAAQQWSTLHLPWGAWSALRRFEPDVIVTGELGPRTAIAAAYAARARVPLVVWTYHARSGAATGRTRRALRRALLSRADAVVGMGRQAREVLEGLGVPPAQLFDAPNAHAADWWRERFEALDPGIERASLRAGLGLREHVALCAGRLEPVKGVAPLLDAWQRLPEAIRSRWSLLFAGDGPLDAAVESARRSLPEGAIARLPAQRPEELARLYAASDLLVFPSLGDTWGLVVNEAMSAGLPVLCSRLAGCADDLVTPGQTGWLFDPLDRARTDAALARALEEPALESLGARARDAAKRFGPASQANGVRRAILHAAARR